MKKSLWSVYGEGSDLIWAGEPSKLPLEEVVNNMPLSSDEVDEGEGGYENVNDPKKLHAVLITGEDPDVSAWNDNMESDAAWFEWRDDEDEDE